MQPPPPPTGIYGSRSAANGSTQQPATVAASYLNPMHSNDMDAYAASRRDQESRGPPTHSRNDSLPPPPRQPSGSMASYAPRPTTPPPASSYRPPLWDSSAPSSAPASAPRLPPGQASPYSASNAHARLPSWSQHQREREQREQRSAYASHHEAAAAAAHRNTQSADGRQPAINEGWRGNETGQGSRRKSASPPSAGPGAPASTSTRGDPMSMSSILGPSASSRAESPEKRRRLEDNSARPAPATTSSSGTGETSASFPRRKWSGAIAEEAAQHAAAWRAQEMARFAGHGRTHSGELRAAAAAAAAFGASPPFGSVPLPSRDAGGAAFAGSQQFARGASRAVSPSVADKAAKRKRDEVSRSPIMSHSVYPGEYAHGQSLAQQQQQQHAAHQHSHVHASQAQQQQQPQQQQQQHSMHQQHPSASPVFTGGALPTHRSEAQRSGGYGYESRSGGAQSQAHYGHSGHSQQQQQQPVAQHHSTHQHAQPTPSRDYYNERPRHVISDEMPMQSYPSAATAHPSHKHEQQAPLKPSSQLQQQVHSLAQELPPASSKRSSTQQRPRKTVQKRPKTEEISLHQAQLQAQAQQVQQAQAQAQAHLAAQQQYAAAQRQAQAQAQASMQYSRASPMPSARSRSPVLGPAPGLAPSTGEAAPTSSARKGVASRDFDAGPRVDSEAVWEALERCEAGLRQQTASVAARFRYGDVKKEIAQLSGAAEPAAEEAPAPAEAQADAAATATPARPVRHLGSWRYDPSVCPLLPGEVLASNVGATLEVRVSGEWLGPGPGLDEVDAVASESQRASEGPREKSKDDAPGWKLGWRGREHARLVVATRATERGGRRPPRAAAPSLNAGAHEGASAEAIAEAAARKFWGHSSLLRRKLWGTDVYTDDSDVVAMCAHAGWIEGPTVPGVPGWVPPGKPLFAWKAMTEDELNEPEAQQTQARASSLPLGAATEGLRRTCDLSVTLRVAPRLIAYKGSQRAGVKSRSWGNTHDGVSLVVESVELKKPGYASEEHGVRGAKKRIDHLAQLRLLATVAEAASLAADRQGTLTATSGAEPTLQLVAQSSSSEQRHFWEFKLPGSIASGA